MPSAAGSNSVLAPFSLTADKHGRQFLTGEAVMSCSAKGLYKHVKILERAFCPLHSPIRCKSDINKSAVRQDQPLEDLEKPSIGWKIIERAVSSLRIDTVTSAGLSVSRRYSTYSKIVVDWVYDVSE